MKPLEKKRKGLHLAILLGPLALLAILIFVFSENIPFWDQWELVPSIELMRSGDLSIGDLWEQHNEHRLFFPKIIMLSLAALTSWNVQAEIV